MPRGSHCRPHLTLAAAGYLRTRRAGLATATVSRHRNEHADATLGASQVGHTGFAFCVPCSRSRPRHLQPGPSWAGDVACRPQARAGTSYSYGRRSCGRGVSISRPDSGHRPSRCTAARGIDPDELGVHVLLGVGEAPVPRFCGLKSQPDPGVAGSGVTLVDRQDMAGQDRGRRRWPAPIADGRDPVRAAASADPPPPRPTCTRRSLTACAPASTPTWPTRRAGSTTPASTASWGRWWSPRPGSGCSSTTRCASQSSPSASRSSAPQPRRLPSPRAIWPAVRNHVTTPCP
jgi:hypothetical protein